MKKNDTILNKDICDKYISLFTSSKLALWEYNCSTSELSFINDYFNLLELSENGIYFSDIESLKKYIHPEDLVAFNTAFAQAISGVPVNELKYRLISSSGATIWLKENFSIYSSKENPSSKTLLSHTKNITKEQKEIEKYHTLLNAITPNFIFIFNQDFTFHDIILPEGLKLFDKPEDLIGQSAYNLYSLEVSELFVENIYQCIKTGKLKNIEYHLDLLGNRYYYQAHIVPYDGDKAFALIQDISDRIRRVNNLISAREQAEEADKMKSAFLANMSHEIRTPLNAIVGFSEIISECGPDENEEKANFLQIIKANNELLLKLINDILDLSRIESGKNELIFHKTNISALINEVKQVHQLKMSPKIKFDIISPSKDLYLETDADRVKQILYNFLSNAIKNTQEGTITLGIEEANNKIRFFVRDTGCGIPQDRLDKIFNRFEKINSFVQGTGLGLSICLTLSKKLGGTLDVESTLGEGSTFSFYLPYKNNRAKDLKKEKKKRTRLVILIAEDTDENYNYARNILKEKYDILKAKDGEEAVKIFMKEKPDLVLMSIQLPGINGLEGAKKMRDISTQTPILGLTSRDFYTEQKMAMESGYNDVISRPYSSTMLKELIVSFV